MQQPFRISPAANDRLDEQKPTAHGPAQAGADGGAVHRPGCLPKRAAVYELFAGKATHRNDLTDGSFWQSLPIASKLLVILVTLEAAAWVVNLVASPVQKCHWMHRDTCSVEQWQVMVFTVTSQVGLTWLTLQAIAEENSYQLVASTLLSVLTSLMWTAFLLAVDPVQPLRKWAGVAGGYVGISLLHAWLTWLTHQQFGWRVHSKMECDFRLKHAELKQQLYFQINKFHMLQRVSRQVLLVNLAQGLVLALVSATHPGASLQHQALEGLLTAVGLGLAPLAWLLAAHLAVAHNSKQLELGTTASFSMLLVWPAFLLYWVLAPAWSWPSSLAARVLLLVVPQALWVVLHALVWASMRQLLEQFRLHDVQQMVADAASSNKEAQVATVPEALQPLLRGAWLLKPTFASPMGWSANLGEAGLGSGTGTGSWGAALLFRLRRGLQAVVLFLLGGSQRRRFFQLSADITTIRWSWNKYVVLYYVDGLTADPGSRTLTLHMALDPDLTLAFEDSATYATWERGLRQLVAELTGAVDGLPADFGGTTVSDTAVAPQHRLVMTALKMQMGAGAGGSAKGVGSKRRLASSSLLAASRRTSTQDPGALKLVQAQAWAQSMQLVAQQVGVGAAALAGLLPTAPEVWSKAMTAGKAGAPVHWGLGGGSPSGPFPWGSWNLAAGASSEQEGGGTIKARLLGQLSDASSSGLLYGWALEPPPGLIQLLLEITLRCGLLWARADPAHLLQLVGALAVSVGVTGRRRSVVAGGAVHLHPLSRARTTSQTTLQVPAQPAAAAAPSGPSKRRVTAPVVVSVTASSGAAMAATAQQQTRALKTTASFNVQSKSISKRSLTLLSGMGMARTTAEDAAAAPAAGAEGGSVRSAAAAAALARSASLPAALMAPASMAGPSSGHPAGVLPSAASQPAELPVAVPPSEAATLLGHTASDGPSATSSKQQHDPGSSCPADGTPPEAGQWRPSPPALQLHSAVDPVSTSPVASPSAAATVAAAAAAVAVAGAARFGAAGMRSFAFREMPALDSPSQLFAISGLAHGSLAAGAAAAGSAEGAGAAGFRFPSAKRMEVPALPRLDQIQEEVPPVDAGSSSHRSSRRSSGGGGAGVQQGASPAGGAGTTMPPDARASSISSISIQIPSSQDGASEVASGSSHGAMDRSMPSLADLVPLGAASDSTAAAAMLQLRGTLSSSGGQVPAVGPGSPTGPAFQFSLPAAAASPAAPAAQPSSGSSFGRLPPPLVLPGAASTGGPSSPAAAPAAAPIRARLGLSIAPLAVPPTVLSPRAPVLPPGAGFAATVAHQLGGGLPTSRKAPAGGGGGSGGGHSFAAAYQQAVGGGKGAGAGPMSPRGGGAPMSPRGLPALSPRGGPSLGPFANSSAQQALDSSFSALDSPRFALSLRIPRSRRSSSTGPGLASAGTSSASSALHDDGYVVNSPSSLASHSSHSSIFKESLTGARGLHGTSSLLSTGVPMTPSGSGPPSATPWGRSSVPRRGMALQVAVEVLDYRSLQMGRQLGKGAEGAVYEARYQDAPVAVKEGPSLNEIEMYMAAGVHDNIVGLRGLCQKENGSWCLVLEFCGRGTLDTMLHHGSLGVGGPGVRRADLQKLLLMMRGIARGMVHLHTRRPPILHRDIKPANIFVGHGMLMKLGDLGMSRHVQDAPPGSDPAGGSSLSSSLRSSLGSRSSSASSPHASRFGQPAFSPPTRQLTADVVGTMAYAAPELLDETLQQPNAPAERILKVDVYSFGVTVWEMIVRQRPRDGLDGMQICALWIANPDSMKLPRIPVPEDAGRVERQVLSALQELVDECTSLDPDARPSFKQILDRIKRIATMYDPSKSAGDDSPDAPAAAAAAPAPAAGGPSSSSSGGKQRRGSVLGESAAVKGGSSSGATSRLASSSTASPTAAAAAGAGGGSNSRRGSSSSNGGGRSSGGGAAAMLLNLGRAMLERTGSLGSRKRRNSSGGKDCSSEAAGAGAPRSSDPGTAAATSSSHPALPTLRVSLEGANSSGNFSGNGSSSGWSVGSPRAQAGLPVVLGAGLGPGLPLRISGGGGMSQQGLGPSSPGPAPRRVSTGASRLGRGAAAGRSTHSSGGSSSGDAAANHPLDPQQ